MSVGIGRRGDDKLHVDSDSWHSHITNRGGGGGCVRRAVNIHTYARHRCYITTQAAITTKQLYIRKKLIRAGSSDGAHQPSLYTRAERGRSCNVSVSWNCSFHLFIPLNAPNLRSVVAMVTAIVRYNFQSLSISLRIFLTVCDVTSSDGAAVTGG